MALGCVPTIQHDFHRKKTYPEFSGSKLQRAVKWKMNLFVYRCPRTKYNFLLDLFKIPFFMPVC